MYTLDNSNFVGFVIANEREEFLLRSRFNQDSSCLVWSKTLSMVKVFQSRREALRIVSKLRRRGLWVFGLFDVDDKLILATDDFVLPSWFSV